MTRFDTVSMLSDYGHADEFVGVLKAVIRDIAPHVTTLDLTHGIAAFDVRAGSLALARSISYVPNGVILALVDPGAGSARRCLAIEVAGGDGVIIGPDNGLLAPAVSMAGGAELAVELTNADYQLPQIGATFAGRDILAPAAAHICNGVPVSELGTPVDPGSLLPGTVPLSRHDGDDLICEVLWVDRFGNAQLNIGPDDLAEWGDHVQLKVGQPASPQGPEVRRSRRVRSYAELGAGLVGLIVDSNGMVSICLDQRSAADELGIVAGDQVVLSELEAPPASATAVAAPTVRR